MADKAPRILIADDTQSIHDAFRDILGIKACVGTASKNLEGIFESIFDDQYTASEVDACELNPTLYRLDFAYQGPEAVAMVRRALEDKDPYELLFVDVRMPPGFDGLETIKQIWRFAPNTEMVLCTAYSDYSWDEIQKQLGKSSRLMFIKKPFDAVAVKQTALTLTEKYRLNIEVLAQMDTLERKVEERTYELRAAQNKEVEANKAKSVFLANMSHEIRTPLNGVIGFTEILRGGNLSVEQRETADTIMLCSENLLALINDILDLSKIEADSLKLENAPYNFEDLIYDCCDVVRSRLSDAPVELLVQMEGVHPILIGDAIRMRQVITNLLSNAIKFTSEGEIVVEVEILAERPDSVDLRIAVRDSGIGMNPAQCISIFESFRQADESTTRKYGGTGLGLAISQKIVRLMESELKVESAIAQGSRFYFDITSAKSKASVDPVLSADEGVDLSHLNCLIVDDNERARRILEHHLRRAGGHFTSVAAGADAIEACKTGHYDIVLLDIVMSPLDGFQTCGAIKSFEGEVPKMVAITSDMRPETILEFKKSGFDEHLFKPVRPPILINTLARLSSQQAATETAEEPALAEGICARILVAEDNLINQKLIKKVLLNMGHHVELAADGIAAVTMAAEGSFDLIFMDMQMPEMDGVEATQQIRAAKNSTPIVAMTANVFESDRQRCLDAGMNAFISKPIDREKVHEVIQEFLNSDR